MSITRIRGEQIKDGVILNQHISDNQIMDAKIASNAAISESKLNIAWYDRYHDALKVRKIVDFVQVNGTAVGGESVVDISAIIPNTVPAVDSTYTAGADPTASTGEGVLATGSKNKAIVRNAATGEPLLDANDNEVYGRVSVIDGDFALSFYSLVSGVETAYTMPANTTIDWQYAKRFNLDAVDEMFASNEKFVEGSADATAHLNIAQLAKDIYGGSAYNHLDRDGNGNFSNGLSLYERLEAVANSADDQEGSALVGFYNDQVRAGATFTAGVANVFDALYDLLDQADAFKQDLAEVGSATLGAVLIGIQDANNQITATTVDGALSEIAAALYQFESDLASTSASEGASLIGVTSNGDYTGATVQAVLDDLSSRTSYLENNGGAEVTETHDRELASTNSYFAQKIGVAAFGTLEDRLLDIETVVDTTAKDFEDRVTSLETFEANIASNAEGNGAAMVSVENNGVLNGSNVQAVLEDIESRTDTLETFDADLGSTAAAKGASKVAVEANSGLNGSDVQAVLEDHETRIDTIETFDADLASTAATKGASMVAVEANSGLNAADVQGVLEDHETRIDANETFDSDLGLTTIGKGASMIAVQNNGVLNGSDVQAVLENIEGRTDTVETFVSDLASTTANKGASLIAVEAGSGLEASDVQSVFENHEGRLDTLETFDTDLGSSAASKGAAKVAVETGTLTDASNVAIADVQTALEDHQSRLVALEGVTHDHFYAHYQVTNNVTSLLNLQTHFGFANGVSFAMGNDSLEVFVNGILQNEGLHYAEETSGTEIDFDFENDGTTLKTSDIVTIKFYK